jgi:hypothetical protein
VAPTPPRVHKRHKTSPSDARFVLLCMSAQSILGHMCSPPPPLSLRPVLCRCYCRCASVHSRRETSSSGAHFISVVHIGTHDPSAHVCPTATIQTPPAPPLLPVPLPPCAIGTKRALWVLIPCLLCTLSHLFIMHVRTHVLPTPVSFVPFTSLHVHKHMSSVHYIVATT